MTTQPAARLTGHDQRGLRGVSRIAAAVLGVITAVAVIAAVVSLAAGEPGSAPGAPAADDSRIGALPRSVVAQPQAAASAQHAPDGASIRAVLAAESLTEVTMSADAQGRWSLRGWVPTAADLARLKGRLFDHRLRYALTACDEVQRYLEEHLRDSRIDAIVRYLGGGRFAIHGAGLHRAQFDAALARIRQNLPAGVALNPQFEQREEQARATVAAPVAAGAGSAQHTIGGIDGVVATPSISYLTAGTHYVFAGGTLRDGAVVRRITGDQIEVTRPGEHRPAKPDTGVLAHVIGP